MAIQIRINLELQTWMEIELKKTPTIRELVETGLLDGHHVSYNFGNQLVLVVEGIKILCNCVNESSIVLKSWKVIYLNSKIK